MDIKILHMVEGAKEATGVAVIIDVFRAFTVEAYLMSNGADKIIPVGDMQIAYDFKAINPDAILIGERHGKILPGFDYGNSPSQLENIDLNNKIVVHTTSAGTQGIANAKKADIILTGSLVNAKAIAEYIKMNGYKEVSLVCMGLEATSQTEEDNLCAYYIKSLLEDKPIELFDEIQKLKMTSGAKFFDKNQQDVFPEKDFYLRLEHMMDIAARSLKVKRNVITKLLNEGLYPYTKRYLGSFNNHFSTIGLVGMNEACLNAKWLRKDLTNEEAQEFTNLLYLVLIPFDFNVNTAIKNTIKSSIK